MSRRIPPRPIAIAVVVLVVAAGLLSWRLAQDDPTLVTADFADTTGVYAGNDVLYLGVPVGEITRIEGRGTTMRVHMELDPGTDLPADAGAEILQTSLITDRVVELGPAYVGGPRLASGAHIDVAHTRSPATVDEIARTVSRLTRALNRTTPGGTDIGDVIGRAADTLDGNGPRIRRAIVESTEALRTLNAHGGDVQAVVRNLARLTRALSARDASIRSFTSDLASATGVVAEQSGSIGEALTALDNLTAVVTRFTRANREVLGEDLSRAAELAGVVRRRQASLAEAFDTMPTLAENMARAYDPSTERLRVQFSDRVVFFSPPLRAALCAQLVGDLCRLLVSADGSGALDPALDLLHDLLPKETP